MHQRNREALWEALVLEAFVDEVESNGHLVPIQLAISARERVIPSSHTNLK